MARENRAENRAKAKEEEAAAAAVAVNAGRDPSNIPDDDNKASQDFSDILNNDEDDVEEVSAGVASAKADEGKEEEGKKENAGESEIDESFIEAPSSVKKEGEAEEGKVAEGKEPEKKAEAGAPADGNAQQKPEEKATAPVPTESTTPAPKAEEDKGQPERLTDEQATKLFSEWRGETETLLAQHHYRMNEKDVEEFNENPAAWVPKAMSRVYLDSISAAFQQFATYLPRMVDQVLEMKKQTNEREESFFAQWPELKEHKQTVLRMGAAYRAQNPSATADDFIKEVGAQAMVALRLTPQGFQQQQATPPAPKPFIPAAQSGTPTPPKPNSNNPFEQLAGEFSMEDLPDDT